MNLSELLKDNRSKPITVFKLGGRLGFSDRLKLQKQKRQLTTKKKKKKKRSYMLTEVQSPSFHGTSSSLLLSQPLQK